MKRIFYHIFVLAAVVIAFSACKEEDPLANVELGNMGITSVSAAFTGELYENDPSATFTGYPDENGNILIEIPYFYPESSDYVVTTDLLKSMRVSAGLEAGTEITPHLGVIDMTQTYHLTAYDAAGRTLEYMLSAEITALSGCSIESMTVSSEGVNYTAIIIPATSTISLMTPNEQLTNCAVTYRISDHATLSGYTEGMTIKPGDEFVVTAHNGIDKTVYTISFDIPEKIGYGARVGSGRSLWTKYYSNDFKFSLTAADVPMRLAAHGDNLYVHTGSGTVHCIDRATGEYLGTVSMPGGLSATSMVSDEVGNILFAEDGLYEGTFTVYVADSMEDSSPIELLSATNDVYSNYMGNIRVAGDVKSDAVVASTVDISRGGKAWQINSGEVTSVSNIFWDGDYLWYQYNGCFQPASSNLSDGVFGFGYWGVYDLYYSSDLTNFSVAYDTEQNSNDNTNCLSIVTFNGARYLAYGVGAHFSYGTCPAVYVVDASTPNAMSNAMLDYIPNTTLGIGGWIGESGASSDVLLVVSEDGYYMDLYFTDANYGVITCYEFDCIQQ